MPWKETCVRDERMRFIARLLDGEYMSHLCEEFGISRKTGSDLPPGTSPLSKLDLGPFEVHSMV